MHSRKPDRRWMKKVRLYTKIGKAIGKYARKKMGFPGEPVRDGD